MRQKNIIRAILLAVLLSAVCTAALAAEFPYISTTSDTVNMRRSASSTSVVLERLAKDEIITVTGQSGNYYAVNARGRDGYVLKSYVTVPGGAAEETMGQVVGTAEGYPYETTATVDVNLRAKESMSSKILTTIPAGATVYVYSVGESFAKVTYEGKEGYCVMDYLRLKEVVYETTAPTTDASGQAVIIGTEYDILQLGSTGSAVKALQSAMKELGFFSGVLDGAFGASTQKAVIAFQEKNKYPATGLVDANLQAFLYNGKPLDSNGKATQIKTLAPIDDVTVHVGDMGELVDRIQIRLRELGYYTGEISGTYDTKSRDAVKAFQKKNGLTADGLVGKNTRLALFGGTALSAMATPTPKPTATPKPTPAPTPAPTYKVPSATVKSGSTGENAKLVQQRLKDLHYFTGKVDGKFGAASVTALKKFQEKHGLKADGIAGAGTYELLFSNDALDAKATATPAPTAVPETLPPVTIVTPVPETTAAPTDAPITKDNVVLVKLGVSGQAVSRLQQRLVALGYYQGAVDGVCKQADVNAIKAFQKKNGLKADGAAGYDTQVKLYSAQAITATGALAGGTVDSFTTLRKGASGAEVTSLQERLIALGYLTGKADGIYGADTVNAVIAFQRANGLTRDGVAGNGTQSMLYSAAAVTPTPAPAATTAPGTGTAKQGDKNDTVKELQQRLISLGYLSGKADGVFGVQTFQAVMAFQRANGLTADGIAGAKTMSALSATVKPTPTVAPAATPAPANIVTAKNVRASQVQYLNWYTSGKAKCKAYPYATVYDFSTGISWQVHMFSLGAHADSEPLTAADTAAMEKAFGGQTWEPKAVWVILGDGTVLMASTHSYPHEVQHITNNNFDGHLCIHFPRTAAQVAAIGPYATRHQATLDAGWQVTQSLK